MSEPEIKSKLSEFLKRHSPVTEECHVVYLLVEARKVLDHRLPQKALPIVRFYADWCVHIEKDYCPPDVKLIAGQMFTATENFLKNQNQQNRNTLSEIAKFVGMETLRDQIGRLLDSLQIDRTKLCADAPWTEFVRYLSAVLGDQPLSNPTADILQIQFVSGADRCAIMFRHPIAGYHSYLFHLS